MIIADGLVGNGITIQTDMPDLGGRDELHDAFCHAESCAKNGNDAELPAGEYACLHRRNGGLDIDLLHGQIAGHLICHERGKLIQKHTEILGSCVLVPHERKLVLNERMVDNGNIFHVLFHICLRFT